MKHYFSLFHTTNLKYILKGKLIILINSPCLWSMNLKQVLFFAVKRVKLKKIIFVINLAFIENKYFNKYKRNVTTTFMCVHIIKIAWKCLDNWLLHKCSIFLHFHWSVCDNQLRGQSDNRPTLDHFQREDLIGWSLVHPSAPFPLRETNYAPHVIPSGPASSCQSLAWGNNNPNG